MKRIANFVKAVFVSPELLFGLIVFGGLIKFTDIFIFLGERIQSQSEVWKFLPAATIALSVFSFKQSSNLRAPLKNTSNKILYEWPHYQLLVDRVLVSILFSICYMAISVAIWILGDSVSFKLTSFLFLESTVLAGVTALTMLLGHQKLVEILELHQ